MADSKKKSQIDVKLYDGVCNDEEKKKTPNFDICSKEFCSSLGKSQAKEVSKIDGDFRWNRASFACSLEYSTHRHSFVGFFFYIATYPFSFLPNWTQPSI